MGDVFGAQQTAPEESFRPEDTGGHWGELPDEDEEDDYDEDEGLKRWAAKSSLLAQCNRRGGRRSVRRTRRRRRASRRPWMGLPPL